MKTTVKLPTEIEISHVLIQLPINYGTDDMRDDFPLRFSDTWIARVEIDTGKIVGWPEGKSGKIEMKVSDGGVYTLLSPSGSHLAKIEDGYVPHGVVPGSYGDYVELEIDANGVITNWPKTPDVSEFFPERD